MPEKYTIKDFLPLIIISVLILFFASIRQFYGLNLPLFLQDFMGFFFFILGTFKVFNLPGFVQAFSLYDIIAKRFKAYAYSYPFIELILAISYLFNIHTTIANWITLILMIIGSIGVTRELAKKKSIICACLGAVFRIPMTYVTLGEDILMGLMAFYMIITGK